MSGYDVAVGGLAGAKDLLLVEHGTSRNIQEITNARSSLGRSDGMEKRSVGQPKGGVSK